MNNEKKPDDPLPSLHNNPDPNSYMQKGGMPLLAKIKGLIRNAELIAATAFQIRVGKRKN
uniref:Uncharacterized protein n=1 Tax=Rhizophora mucronata TaxID=61149 RepID=A0A2P2Q7H9_RHIMU